jgi:predicted GNAT family acetyltransferase
MTHEVRRNEARRRYELVDDDRVVGIADYELVDDSTMVLPHTEIDARQRGRGLGAILVRGVLDDARARGVTVIPTCWFVREYIEQHPDQEDLLAR